ncbi:outer membrane-stress sensor serine endopeptidase DegS [Shewanella maritima]|uniref:outer membrane-stress sensor serine endopeptidase DegS n=1 Tax=Shewanella maritima TaxID=2520507 RepID=UPI00373613C5
MNIKNIFLYLAKAVLFGLVIAGVFLLFNKLWQHDSFPNLSIQTQQSTKVISFSKAVRNAAPAVVNIYSLSIDQQRPLTSSSLQGLGSGVIMSHEGYILTNYHVIKKADEIVVALQDGRKFTSEVVGSDPETDLSVIKIEGDNLPLVPINLNKTPKVGDLVLAIGNPYNLGQTITQGIISATGRNGLSSGFLDFLQTDAAINAGNSGGALIDSTGELIGINTAAFQVGGESSGNGISFAIPIKLAHSIMGKLIEHGRVIRGALGFSGEALNPVVAQILNLPDLNGVLVTDIDPDGPAARSDLMPRDVIIRYNGEDIPGTEILMDRIAETLPGDKAILTVIRGGKEQAIEVIVGEKYSPL